MHPRQHLGHPLVRAFLLTRPLASTEPSGPSWPLRRGVLSLPLAAWAGAGAVAAAIATYGPGGFRRDVRVLGGARRLCSACSDTAASSGTRPKFVHSSRGGEGFPTNETCQGFESCFLPVGAGNPASEFALLESILQSMYK